MSKPYWLEIPLIEGSKEKVKDGEIIIVGSGLAGVSTAYWLQQKGFTDITLVDFQASDAASFRNCGHILYGTVESMLAMVALHGETIARDLWKLSIDICHEVRDTVKRESLDVDYKQDGYLVIAVEESEHQEILRSIELLNRYGFQSDYIEKIELEKKGFRNVCGARFEAGSAQAHPTKFRNGLLKICLDRGLKYHSNVKVLALDEHNSKVESRSTASKAFNMKPLLLPPMPTLRFYQTFLPSIAWSNPFVAKSSARSL
jgi:glycine/D-amino acid oxidase-like deaminating enzyme